MSRLFAAVYVTAVASLGMRLFHLTRLALWMQASLGAVLLLAWVSR